MLLSVLVVSVALASAGTALAVDVSGSLRIASDFAGTTPPIPEEEARKLWYWNEWNGFIEPGDRGFDAARDLAVVLVGDGPMADEQPGFRIANGGLWPTTLVVRSGTAMAIQNTDPCAHQLFAEGHPQLNPTPIAPGLSRELTPTETGAWPLRDELYTHVTGHLHIIDNLVARATVESDGDYRFANVEPGVYTLVIYRGSERIHEQADIEVTERELTIPAIPLRAGASAQ
ncbi:MAG: carboxypeptidase-like regulatory domain-containing protein [Sandaracinaceae bacterium]